MRAFVAGASGSETYRQQLRVISCCDRSEISSAVSAVLRSENMSRSEAAGAEQCGYGDLR